MVRAVRFYKMASPRLAGAAEVAARAGAARLAGAAEGGGASGRSARVRAEGVRRPRLTAVSCVARQEELLCRRLRMRRQQEAPPARNSLSVNNK